MNRRTTAKTLALTLPTMLLAAAPGTLDRYDATYTAEG